MSQRLYPLIRTRLVDYNSNYIGIRIDITRNTKYCNVMLIIIHSFSDNTIIEPGNNGIKAF